MCWDVHVCECVYVCICIYAVAVPSKRINELKRFKSDRQFVRHLSFTFYSSLFNRYRLYSLMVTKKKRKIDLRVGVLYRPNKSVTNATKLKYRLFAVNTIHSSSDFVAEYEWNCSCKVPFVWFIERNAKIPANGKNISTIFFYLMSTHRLPCMKWHVCSWPINAFGHFIHKMQTNLYAEEAKKNEQKHNLISKSLWTLSSK